MAELEASPNPNPKPKKPTLCEECGSNPWKYRCPSCSRLTCSLPCVKSHKQHTSCTGKRNRTEFVPLSQFDDDRLFSDYNFLEETKRVMESAHRMLAEFREGFRFNKMPVRLRLLRNAAYRRRIRLMILPPGMSKREKNRSRYDQRKNCMYWTLEWRFHSTDVILIDHSIHENMSLYSVIEKHLAPTPWNNQLRPFCNVRLDDLKFFLRKNAKGAMSPFRQLNIKDPIGLQLKDSVIVEYPVIYVFLPSHCYNFEIEKDTRSFCKNEEPVDSPSSNQSPKGTFFKEEEIEEGEMLSDTKVVDLMDHKILEPCNNTQIPKNVTISEKGLIRPSKRMSDAPAEYLIPISSSKCGANVEESGGHSSSSANLKNFPEEEIFDFQQEVKDAYSDFIGEINPDDFLCLDSGCSEEDESQERKNLLGFGGEPYMEEALEEGEIPTPN
ncbi:putative box C/D snoRNA protein SPCC613.07 [Elaeis guineensis]|uniref:putative box C/D snoRNA protein SPCC613.07 n=1 Tax=Elaeis guineensis var. tenera TaxID=51953 RepID=UPI003C6D7B9B